MTVIRTAAEHLEHLLPATASERIAAACAAPLPLSVDLSAGDSYDQGQSNSCSTHALCKGIEIVSGYIGSMRGLYADTGNADDGRRLVDVLHAARTTGVAAFLGDVDGRYSDVASPPNAVQELPMGTARIPLDLGEHIISPQAPDLSDQMAATLASGCPVYFATAVGRSFDSLTMGTVAEPDPTATTGHALLVVGYREASTGERQFRVENSWGAWDENGECWVSLSFLAMSWELHPLIYTGKPPAGPSLIDKVRAAVMGLL
jgi:hypothetical protein